LNDNGIATIPERFHPDNLKLEHKNGQSEGRLVQNSSLPFPPKKSSNGLAWWFGILGVPHTQPIPFITGSLFPPISNPETAGLRLDFSAGRLDEPRGVFGDAARS